MLTVIGYEINNILLSSFEGEKKKPVFEELFPMRREGFRGMSGKVPMRNKDQHKTL